MAIKVDPNTDLVYLAGRGDLGVGVHDPFSLAVVGFLDTGPGAADMTTDADENALYVATEETNRVVVFHRIRRNPIGDVDVGSHPTWVNVMGEN